MPASYKLFLAVCILLITIALGIYGAYSINKRDSNTTTNAAPTPFNAADNPFSEDPITNPFTEETEAEAYQNPFAEEDYINPFTDQ